MNIKRAFLKVEKLIEFLDSKEHDHVGYWGPYGLPTIEDAQLLVKYLESRSTGRAVLISRSLDFMLYEMKWRDYLDNPNNRPKVGRMMKAATPEECQQVAAAFAYLEEAGYMLEEFEGMTQPAGESQSPAEAVSIQEEAQGRGAAVELPAELATEAALKYWKKAQAAGWVKDDYSFNGTRYQAAYFAQVMGEKLELKNNRKWVPFKKLWNFDKFSQTRRESKERFGKVEKSQEIDRLFED